MDGSCLEFTLIFLLNVPFLFRAFLPTVLHFWEDAGPTQSLCVHYHPSPREKPPSAFQVLLQAPGGGVPFSLVRRTRSVSFGWGFMYEKLKGKKKNQGHLFKKARLILFKEGPIMVGLGTIGVGEFNVNN